MICVGNYTAGGSGKTPFTAMLAQRLIARGERPVILTRGYGGATRGPHWVNPAADTAAMVGDEPLLLAQIAPTIVCRDRRVGAETIERTGTATVIVMDDGLQNAALIKNLSIAIVDGARGLGNGLVIPAGPLRAPLRAQSLLVDAIVFNGAASSSLAEMIAGVCAAPQIGARLEPVGDVSWLVGARVVAFAGIGNPARFFETLTGLGANVVEAIALPDHGVVSPAVANRLLALATQHRARLITTQKDHVRLGGNPACDGLVATTAVLPVRFVLDDAGAHQLNRLLDGVLAKPPG